MRKKSQSSGPAPSGSSAPTRRERRQQIALHLILGLALLFLAGVLMSGAVSQFRQSGITVTAIVSLLGFLLFCILALMLLSSELRSLFSKIAAKRQGRHKT